MNDDVKKALEHFVKCVQTAAKENAESAQRAKMEALRIKLGKMEENWSDLDDLGRLKKQIVAIIKANTDLIEENTRLREEGEGGVYALRAAGNSTNSNVANMLLQRLEVLQRIGDAAHAAEAMRWMEIIRQNSERRPYRRRTPREEEAAATPEPTPAGPMAVNFATSAAKPEGR